MLTLSHFISKAQTDDWESISNHEADTECWTYWAMPAIRYSSDQRWWDQLSSWQILMWRQLISTLRDCLFKQSTQIFICIMLTLLFIVCIVDMRSAMIRAEDSAEKKSDISIVWAELTELTSLNLSELAAEQYAEWGHLSAVIRAADLHFWELILCCCLTACSQQQKSHYTESDSEKPIEEELVKKSFETDVE